jgi:hypothetical protein
VDQAVWDRLGGRDTLALGIGARGFMSSQSVYRTTEIPIVIKVRQAVCTYRGRHGRKRRFRVVESHMTGTITPSLVIIDIRPAYWTLEWLAWILDPNGDADPLRHRSQFYVGRLAEMSDEKLLGQVEDVVGMRINPFGGFPQPDQIN